MCDSPSASSLHCALRRLPSTVKSSSGAAKRLASNSNSASDSQGAESHAFVEKFVFGAKALRKAVNGCLYCECFRTTHPEIKLHVQSYVLQL